MSIYFNTKINLQANTPRQKAIVKDLLTSIVADKSFFDSIIPRPDCRGAFDLNMAKRWNRENWGCEDDISGRDISMQLSGVYIAGRKIELSDKVDVELSFMTSEPATPVFEALKELGVGVDFGTEMSIAA